jgi:hypothetical protein
MPAGIQWAVGSRQWAVKDRPMSPPACVFTADCRLPTFLFAARYPPLPEKKSAEFRFSCNFGAARTDRIG